ncbi:caspase family protein, partial [Streptomyces toxytricini]|uniref:caspase family protein n=1 Tax=Streptomyces toxytricini TaxID=67369 RepID=UPI003422E18B
MTGDSPVARFDPRGKVNRALLVGVPEYAFKQPKHPAGVSGDLPAVAHNLTELERVLSAGGVFGPDGVTVSRPRNVDEFDRELYTAAAEAEGLLLLYFSGHGAVPSTGDGLWLQMRRATIVPGAESVFLGAAPGKGVLAVLSGARAEQVVVVLDCCYAGNAAAAWDALGTSQRRRTSVLMSVQANNRIDAGDDDTPTPFTARLVELLEGGLRGRGGEVTFAGLADRLRAYMSAHHTTLREPPEPWEPQSRPATSGADVLLAVAARRPPRLPVTPPTGGPTGPGTPGTTPGSDGAGGPDGAGVPPVAAGSGGHGGEGDTDAVAGPGETGGAGGRDGAGDPGSTAGVGGSAGSHATSPDTTGGPDDASASHGSTHGLGGTGTNGVGGRVGHDGPNTSGAACGGNGPGAPGGGNDHGSGAGSGGTGSGPPGGGNGSGAAGGESNTGGTGTGNASGTAGRGNGSGTPGGGGNSGPPGGRTDSGAVGGEGATGRPGGGNGSDSSGGSSGSGATGDGNGSAAVGGGSGSGTSGDGNGSDTNGEGGGGKGSGRWAFDPRRITTLVGVPAAALSLIVAGLTYFGGADRPPCRPPLELRLLTDPDLEPTVRKAAEAYLSSAGNRTADGCRRSGITVYSAGSAAVTTAFGRQSGHWLRPAGEEDNPQRDIGPQPDIWIPASPGSVERARPAADESAYADLTADPAPFAYSPVVLAVPQNLSGEALADRTGRLGALTAALRQRDPKAEVRRTDPEHTDAG